MKDRIRAKCVHAGKQQDRCNGRSGPYTRCRFREIRLKCRCKQGSREMFSLRASRGVNTLQRTPARNHIGFPGTRVRMTRPS